MTSVLNKICVGRHRSEIGVTLLELLVTIGVVSILLALVLPSFFSQSSDVRRGVLAADMNRAVIAMEKYYASNGYSYVGAAAGTTFPNKSPADGSAAHYNLVLVSSESTYTITAVPQNNQTSDFCGQLSVNQAGIRTAEGSIDDCWR